MVTRPVQAIRPRILPRPEDNEAWEGTARLGKTIVIADDPLDALR